MVKDLDFKLYNGVNVPAVGLGTWQTPDGEQAYDSVRWALEAGYRHVDTAYVYENERSVGRAIKDSGVARESVFITTKLPSDVKSYEGALEYFDRSLKNLDCGYIDLYLIHAPWPWSDVGRDCTQGNIEAWKGLIELYEKGRARSVGVSNFSVKDMEAIIGATGFKPMANQIRYFVGNTQPQISDYCNGEGILVEAYSPLATGELLGSEILCAIAEKYGKSVAKICLAYCLQKGALPLPKSTHRERIFDNIDVNFTLSDEDMAYLDGLHHIASTRKLRD